MNYKRILPSNSIKSASSSRKSVPCSKEISDLNGEIESLKQVIESLKSSVESKDTSIGTLAHEKEKVFVELKSAQRTIRSLRQQLSDERTIYIKEKEFLAEEIQRLSRNDNLESTATRPRTSLKQKNVVGIQKKYEEKIDSLQDQLLEKDEIICKLCAKYMTLKNNKSRLHSKYQQLKTEVQETHDTAMCCLEENKQVMDKAFRNFFRFSSISSDSKKYLKLLKQNIKLITENAQLKLSMSPNLHEKNEPTKSNENNETNSIAVTLPPQPTQRTLISQEDIKHGSKPYRSDWTRYKWRRNKLNKSNYWLNPALLESLYRKNKSLSAQLLQESRRKSKSMPCLSL